MKMEPIVSSETSAIRTQTPGNYPKRNNLHLEHGESLRTRFNTFVKQLDDEELSIGYFQQDGAIQFLIWGSAVVQ